MQAVILAGGESSRFFPFNLKPKPLLTIAGEPIISHTIRSIKRSGITDIVLLTGPNRDFQDKLGTGKKLGVKITYASIAKPTGMGEALLVCAKHIKSDFFLVNPQHVGFDLLKKSIDEVRTNREAVLLGKEQPIGKQYGMLKIDGNRVLEVVEKPKSAKGLSNYRIVGVYFLNQEFISLLKKIKTSHYSFEDALNEFAKLGKVRLAKASQDPVTLKFPWDVLGVKDFVLNKMPRSISKKATIAKSAIITGNVVIEEGAKIDENALIKGPVYIGKNVYIGSNTLIRSSVSIEEGAKIGAYMEIKNSLVGSSSSTHSGFLGDSVVGEETKIGALFGTANVRLDRGNVKSVVKQEKVDTTRRSLGVMIGSHVRIGERVSTMPGVIIGNNSTIGPSTTVMENVPSDVIYYSKFESIVKKQKPAS